MVRAVLALALGAEVTADGLRDLPLAGLYVAAFALAGGIAGALWPLRRTWWGALLIGYISAGIVCAACGVIVMQIDHRRDGKDYVIVVSIMTAVYGTVAAYHFRKE